MLTHDKLSLELKEIINECESITQVNVITKAISTTLYSLANKKKSELTSHIPDKLESFYNFSITEKDQNFRRIFESKHDLDISNEY